MLNSTTYYISQLLIISKPGQLYDFIFTETAVVQHVKGKPKAKGLPDSKRISPPKLIFPVKTASKVVPADKSTPDTWYLRMSGVLSSFVGPMKMEDQLVEILQQRKGGILSDWTARTAAESKS